VDSPLEGDGFELPVPRPIFGGYRFGRSERHFLVLGPRRRAGRLPPLAALQAISPLITVIFGTALIGLLAAWITARAQRHREHQHEAIWRS
jgi:hypothetical protein